MNPQDNVREAAGSGIHLINAIEQAGGNIDLRDCPFPGLLPFQEKDAPFFFGRDREIAEILSRLSRQRFLGVIGVSGSGKSSVVHAGLKPELRLQRWHIFEIKPGIGPAGQLAAGLAAQLPGPDWSKLLAGSSYGLSDGIGKALKLAEQDAKLLIIVDQFEEIFEYRDKHPEEADLFVQQIMRAASFPGLPAYILLTMRTDFLGKCALFRNLPEALNDGSYLVPRLTRKEQEEAIRSPLAVSGVEIESSLVDDLLNAAEKNRDELPVLQHLLKRLWEESRGVGSIREEHLRKTGGWNDAIARDANGVLNRLSGSERDAIRLVFQYITKKGAGDHPVRTPAGFGELAEICGSVVSRQRLREIMGEFRKRDLLVWESEDRIDIPHECITWRWKILVDWIEEEDRDRQLLDFIAASKRGNLPLAGFKLDEAMALRARLASPEWAARYEHNAGELKTWVFHSAQRHTRQVRNRRLIMLGLALAALLFAGLAALAFGFWRSLGSRNGDLKAAGEGLRTRNEELKRIQGILLRQNGWSNERIESASADSVAQSLDAGEALQRLMLPTSGAEPPTRGLGITYYPKRADGETEIQTLLQYWNLLGYRPSSKTAVNSMATNTIWFRGEIRSDDLKRIALTLIRAGIQLRAIFHLTTSGPSGVFIGNEPSFDDFKPWSVREITESHGLGSLETARQFAIVLLKPESAAAGEPYLLSKHIFFTNLRTVDPLFNKNFVTNQVPVDQAEGLRAELESHGIHAEIQKP